MSDLTQTRDHARRMATADHQPDCDTMADRWRGERHCDDEATHPAHDHDVVVTDELTVEAHCPGRCTGCVTDADRTLWAQLADEIDRHLGAAT